MGMEGFMKGDTLSLIEGCMGLFDGAVGAQGSNAEVAESLGVPIILVVNARSMAHSAAPLLYGYLHYRPSLRYAGVIYNNVGSARHAQMLRRAAEEVGIPVLGCIPRQSDLCMPSRHLGLDLSERERINSLANRIADVLEANLEPSFWEELCVADSPSPLSSSLSGTCPPHQIFVARDEAFNFMYQETLDRLCSLGTIHFFSPLANEPVPAEADVVYLPGGYPEFFLSQLAESKVTMESLRRTKAHLIAECGGMMYLGDHVDGVPMAGLLPVDTTMLDAHLHLGYRILPQSDGTELRGHEFHYSSLTRVDDTLHPTSPFLDAQRTPVDTLLFRHERIIASYVHWSPTSIIKILSLAQEAVQS